MKELCWTWHFSAEQNVAGIQRLQRRTKYTTAIVFSIVSRIYSKWIRRKPNWNNLIMATVRSTTCFKAYKGTAPSKKVEVSHYICLVGSLIRYSASILKRCSKSNPRVLRKPNHLAWTHMLCSQKSTRMPLAEVRRFVARTAWRQLYGNKAVVSDT